MTVRILTTDKYFERLLYLLADEAGYAVCPSGEMVWVDLDTVKAPVCDKCIGFSDSITRSDMPILPHLFAHEDLFSLCRTWQSAPSSLPQLTPTEEKLFRLLEQAGGNPVSKETLIRAVWGEQGDESILHVYIHYLRKKLEKDGKRRIFSARGKGYYYPC